MFFLSDGKTKNMHVEVPQLSGVFACLGDVTHGFVTDISRQYTSLPDAILLTCKYHLECYSQALYSVLDVQLPDQLRSAVSKRKAEFLAGRVLARAALAEQGFPVVDIPIGGGGAPVWPASSVGSISHTEGMCACLVATNTPCSVGVDVERVASEKQVAALMENCITEKEHTLMDIRADMTIPQYATLIFSAKETLFKLLYPHVRQHFGFFSAELCALPKDGYLQLGLTRNLSGAYAKDTSFSIRYEVTTDTVTTWSVARLS